MVVGGGHGDDITAVIVMVRRINQGAVNHTDAAVQSGCVAGNDVTAVDIAAFEGDGFGAVFIDTERCRYAERRFIVGAGNGGGQRGGCRVSNSIGNAITYLVIMR